MSAPPIPDFGHRYAVLLNLCRELIDARRFLENPAKVDLITQHATMEQTAALTGIEAKLIRWGVLKPR